MRHGVGVGFGGLKKNEMYTIRQRRGQQQSLRVFLVHLRISPPDFSPPYISPPQIFTTEGFFPIILVSTPKVFIPETFYHQTFIIGKMYFIEFLIRICFADFHSENLSNILKINYKYEKLIQIFEPSSQLRSQNKRATELLTPNFCYTDVMVQDPCAQLSDNC